MSTAIRKTVPRFSSFILNHEWHSLIIGFLVGILMLSIYLWIAGGVVTLLIALVSYMRTDWAPGAETMIRDIVIILAAFELIRTLQSYLILGRVRVTFILDAALVVLIGELISLSYGEYTPGDVLINIGVISVLTILRIVTTKYPPDYSPET